MALWYQHPFGELITVIAIILWLVLACITLRYGLTWRLMRYGPSLWLYGFMFVLMLIWYFNIEAKQDREWAPEVEKVLTVEQHGDIVTLHNVRNFNWHSENRYDPRWETRTVDLNQISGVNIITSYWMGPQIAHTLVSFDFYNSPPLTFSIEIRKEKNESFSALGGFFRKFELSLVAADEKDIIFTRSNIRKEQVYFFPIRMPQSEARALFEEYLHTAQQLQQTPRWYNTLTSNCTTLVFDMAQAISQHQYPSDYRLILSGYLPNYLYDLNAFDHQWSMADWYRQAHINPKTEAKNNITSAEYSALIRQGLKPAP
ncbi:DUF4105 domain-containing protein [Acinetobacter sp. SAAs470]|nr:MULTISPECIES: DUF4105 domain-containing protein [unclassified Acinetobacter]WOE33180.1 DUF4105 domain-containing protein [Acinetobacter sp. SAAs470]WOE39841.1 DUF4105 domain-containing protein [Acinetobacter sp. SAAs474]